MEARLSAQHTMSSKRKRADHEIQPREPIPTRRRRHHVLPDLLSPLSDELLVRILTFLALPDVLSVASVSRRFYDLSGDSQVWKGLYYSQFVLPRALRIPGFRDGSVREGKLHYSSRKAIWADGRRGGWVDMRSDGRHDESRTWKRQYKLRHNWSKGKCAVEELRINHDSTTSPIGAESPHKMLVKISEGIALTVDSSNGLRAWDLKTKAPVAQISLREQDSTASPSNLGIDHQSSDGRTLDVAVGFSDGSFGVWRLDVPQKTIIMRYRHEKSSNGELIGIALSYPYVLTATKSVLISLYTFEGPSKVRPDTLRQEVARADNKRGSARETERKSEDNRLQSPYLLTSLKSHTSRAPLALSIRKTGPGNIIASIAYTFSTLQGWSLGIQDLHLQASPALSKTPVEITSRLAYTMPVRPAPSYTSSAPLLTPQPISSLSSTTTHVESPGGPISLCYTHPYLLATLPDNTLLLYLCTSTASTLSISPGIRLWGHTSGISDAEITARGKAVSVSCRGEEIRVWELEGRAEGKSIEVRPIAKPTPGDVPELALTETQPLAEWDERRNWVGFDDEMVIVLKESQGGGESLMVYDFT